MKEWKTYKLSEIGQVIGGATPSTKVASNYDGDIAWITPKDLSLLSGRYVYKGERCITEAGYKSCSCQMLPAGSILFSSRAPIGYIAIAGNELCTNQGFKSVVPNPEIVNSHFLYYLLSYEKNRIAEMGSGTTFMEISGNVMKNIEVKLPDLSIQNKIAEILTSLDEKIENNKRINDNLEQQAQALYKSWFVDFEPFREGEFIESELGLIPSTWRTSSLLKMINVMSGGTPKTNEDKYWNGEIPFFTPKDNDSSIYCHSTEKYITELGLSKCNSLLYPKDTIFVTARGTVGKICLSGTAMAMNQSCYAIVANDSSQQLFWYYTISNLIRVIKNKANGAVFDAITVKDFDEVIVIPDNSTINSFVQRVSAMFESINNNLLENINLAKQRDSLLPKLMSGELKINEIDC